MGVQPVSVLRGTLVRVLIDKSYSLRLVMRTELDGEHLLLVLNVSRRKQSTACIQLAPPWACL